MNTQQQTYTETYLLKPKWSRFLHRMHTLGTIRQKYHNNIVSVTSEGEYPRLITTPNEDKSIAINGNHQWSFENWHKVTVRVAAEYQQADFLFATDKGEIFHEISLTAKSQWGCFECMLKIFENESSEFQQEEISQESISTFTKINNSINLVAKAVNREIIRGKKVICSIPLAGSSILKDMEFKSLMTQFGTAALKTNHAQLTLNAQAVAHHEIDQESNKFLTTLFNADSIPLLKIQSV